MLIGIILLMLAGGGVYAAGAGLLGAKAQAEEAKLKSEALAELAKIEAGIKADLSKIKAAL